jgi:hypothetical protein
MELLLLLLLVVVVVLQTDGSCWSLVAHRDGHAKQQALFSLSDIQPIVRC